MPESMEATPSVPPSLDLQSVRSELEELQRSLEENEAYTPDSLGSEKLLKECALHLESRLQQILSEYSNVDSFLGIDDLDAYVEHMKEELVAVEAESSKISNEIEVLKRTNIEDSNKLKMDLEVLKLSLDRFTSQDPEEATFNCSSMNGEDQMNIVNRECNAFEVLELEGQIEQNKKILKSLQEVDKIFKSLDVIEQVEDTIGGMKVIDVADNFIRLSLRTHIPNLEDFSTLQRLEGIIEKSVLDHELLIEVLEGTMELKNAEIFPGDVHLHDIINASKSISNSSLEWFVRKVQDRIVLCTLRRFVVKSANKSSHSFEYFDQDEMIICSMIGGIDACIKVSQGWPLADSPLKLISLKSSDHYTKGVSLSLICKKMANSLDARICRNLSSFADAVEKILKEQMHLELQADSG
ncbi:uncharacterized protein LOC120085576 isoform X2 [Benincasa hispida]|uniref:uncharacterized protein LOC120085576 isoform X2 n=1 Tax=Benincasa hispida TaxID=102211 RepID=UPI001900913C|nr:uncharacterized protein LOC120085576 isoform X2 [Benincasa hispida]